MTGKYTMQSRYGGNQRCKEWPARFCGHLIANSNFPEKSIRQQFMKFIYRLHLF